MALPGQVSALSSQVSAFDARLAQCGAGLERIERSANGGIAAAMAMGGTVKGSTGGRIGMTFGW